jgi:hypothetical protein
MVCIISGTRINCCKGIKKTIKTAGDGDCIVVAYFHGKLDFNPVKGGAKGDH